VKNFLIAEPDDSVAEVVQALGPGFVIFDLLVVYRPIYLNHELARRAIEIEHERAYRMLTPETEAAQLSPSDRVPQYLLRGHQQPSQASRGQRHLRARCRAHALSSCLPALPIRAP